MSWREAVTALRGLDGGKVAALVGMNGLLLTLMNGRWWLVLRAQGQRLPFWRLFAYRLGAYSISFFTPGPQFGGEPFQGLMLTRRHGVAQGMAAATVTLDKALELVVSFSFLAVGIGVVGQRRLLPELTAPALPLALGLLAMPAFFLTSTISGKYPLSGAWRRLPRRWQSRFPQFSAGIQETEAIVGTFCRTYPRTLALILLLSVAAFLVLIAEYWLMLHFLGATLTATEVIMAFTVVRLSLLAPTPGALGAVEAGQVLALGALGYNPAVAISLSLISRARDVGFGLLGLAYAGWQWQNRRPGSHR